MSQTTPSANRPTYPITAFVIRRHHVGFIVEVVQVLGEHTNRKGERIANIYSSYVGDSTVPYGHIFTALEKARAEVSARMETLSKIVKDDL